MNNLYEKEDILNSPYDVFLFDNVYCPKPVLSHWHYFIELLYFTDGKAHITCDNKTYTIKSDELIIFHPESIHSIVNATNEHLQFYVIKFDLNKLHTHSNYLHSIASVFRMAKKADFPRITFTSKDFNSVDLLTLFKNCLLEMTKKDYGYDIEFQSYMTQLLTEVIRIWRHEGFKFEKEFLDKPSTHNLQNILEYIDEHSAEQISIANLAQMYNMSYSHFAKCFRMQYGRSCKNYIEFIRLNKVKDLLLFTEYDLTYISNETGFSDCSHLIRVFKKSTGTTPKKFRSKYRI